ncbi:MAG: GntR family transcriptional regulator [Synergistaceae bacterium]|nr:GntR family transcriptional regulator [Synergistaceae bacterium]
MLELRKKYKSGSALEILQEAILTGDLPEGIIITQNELALSLGTSRMPVREALISLEYQGFIERMPSQHIKAATFTDEYIRSLFADMATLEVEALKSLPDGELEALSSCRSQMDFHRALRRNIYAPLRRKMLETFTEIYLPFVLEHSENVKQIDLVFMNLLQAVKAPLDIDVTRAAYAVYSEVLSGSLIRIRKGRKSHAEP